MRRDPKLSVVGVAAAVAVDTVADAAAMAAAAADAAVTAAADAAVSVETAAIAETAGKSARLFPVDLLSGRSVSG
jgi:hypothetical protein